MAKLNIDKIYSELNKEDGANELLVAFESIRDFIAKKISQDAKEKEEEANALNEIVQKISGN